MSHPAGRADGREGLSLVELLVAMAILGMVAVSLASVLDVALKQSSAMGGLAGDAQFALNRIALLAEETSAIISPAVGATSSTFTVRERVFDNYKNGSTVYKIEGDGLLDADINGNRVVETSLLEPITPVIFAVAGGALKENWNDYGMRVIDETLCSNVTAFTAERETTNLVRLSLTVQQGGEAITLVTRVRARNMPP